MAQILKIHMMMYLQLQNDWSQLGCHDAAVMHHKSIYWKWKAQFWAKKHISRQVFLELSVSTTNFMCMLMLQCLPSSNVGHKITQTQLLILIQYNIGRQKKDRSLNICHGFIVMSQIFTVVVCILWFQAAAPLKLILVLADQIFMKP